MADDITPAHKQRVTHSYWIAYPDHEPRSSDPHYKDFEAFKTRTKATARCAMAVRFGGEEAAGCDTTHPLETHHAHIEFAIANSVDLSVLEQDYPGVSNPDEVGAWIETAANLEWLCQFHHRGHGGKHIASVSDFEGERYVRGLIS